MVNLHHYSDLISGSSGENTLVAQCIVKDTIRLLGSESCVPITEDLTAASVPITEDLLTAARTATSESS